MQIAKDTDGNAQFVSCLHVYQLFVLLFLILLLLLTAIELSLGGSSPYTRYRQNK